MSEKWNDAARVLLRDWQARAESAEAQVADLTAQRDEAIALLRQCSELTEMRFLDACESLDPGYDLDGALKAWDDELTRFLALHTSQDPEGD